MGTITIQPDGNAGIDAPISNGAYASLNFQNNTLGAVGSVFAVGITVFTRFVLRFDLSAIPAGASIIGVSLTLHSDGTGATSGPIAFSCQRLTRTTWAESSVTWNTPWTSPGGDSTATHAATAQAQSGDASITFSGLEAMLADAGGTQLDLLISGPESLGASSYINWLLSETTTDTERPRIDVVYDLVTDAGWVAKRRLAHYSAEERQLLDYTARKRLIEWSAPHDD